MEATVLVLLDFIMMEDELATTVDEVDMADAVTTDRTVRCDATITGVSIDAV